MDVLADSSDSDCAADAADAADAAILPLAAAAALSQSQQQQQPTTQESLSLDRLRGNRISNRCIRKGSKALSHFSITTLIYIADVVPVNNSL